MIKIYLKTGISIKNFRDPYPLVKGTDPRIWFRIWIRTKMSRILNTACNIKLTRVRCGSDKGAVWLRKGAVWLR
jgi:hypothetical protein